MNRDIGLKMIVESLNKKPTSFLILGQGALAADILDVHPSAGCVGSFVEQQFYSSNNLIEEHIPSYDNISNIDVSHFIIGVGGRELRKRFIKLAEQKALIPFPALTSHARYISIKSIIGAGTVFGFNIIIERNVCIGKHCLLMHNVLVSHDVLIGNNVVIAPGVVIEGNVTIGDNVFIGANVTIAPNVIIGKNCHLSIGTACFKDIPESKTVIGNPARIISSINPSIA